MKLILILEETLPASRATRQTMIELHNQAIDDKQALEDAIFRLKRDMNRKIEAFRKTPVELP